MRFTQYLGLLFVMALAMSVNAFAKGTHKEANSGNFTVQEHVQIGSTDIAPGQYKAEWSGPANNLQVEILQHGKTVATTEGSIKNLPQPSPYTAVVTKTESNHTKQVQEIDFNHRSEALTIAG